MNFNYRNLIVDNIFTKEEIDQIYLHVAQTPEEQKKLVTEFGHIAYFSWLPENIVSTITESARSITNLDIELKELSFARYSTAMNGKPLLFPHLDETFKEPRLTFDIQVKATLDWPLVVEGREYTLKDNQALTFSGTHQIHWRKHIEFTDDDYVDMIFCHFSLVGAEPNTLDQNHYAPLVRAREEWSRKYWAEKESTN